MKEDNLITPLNPMAAHIVAPLSEAQLPQTPEQVMLFNSNSHPIEGDLLQARDLAGKFPDSPTALARLAISEASFGNRGSAWEAAQTVLQNEIFDAPACIAVSQVAANLGEIRAAEYGLRRVLESSSAKSGAKRSAAVLAARLAIQQGYLDRALELLEKHESEAGAALKGALLVQLGRCHNAIRELRFALRNIPDSPSTLCNLGYAYALAGSLSKAIRATSAAVALAPADRIVSLNLAFFLLSQGETSKALLAIDRFAAHYPNDVQLEIAAVAVLHIEGDLKGALRCLQRADASLDIKDDSSVSRQELRFYINLLRTPANPSKEVLASAFKALKRCDYASEMLARLLPQVAQTIADLPILETVYAELTKRFNRSVLLAVEQQVAFLRVDFDRSLEVALQRVEAEPFSAAAHIFATYLMSLYKGDYQKAAQIGLAGVKCGIGNSVLRNNVAFALALAGDLDGAERVLPDFSECDFALPTLGLIKVVRGEINEGITLYEESERRFRSTGDSNTADIIVLSKALAMVAGGHRISEDYLSGLDRYKDTDPRFVLTQIAIKRETSAVNSSGGHDRLSIMVYQAY